MPGGKNIHDFTTLFNQHSRRFVDFAATYVGRDAAEDIVMDAFLYYWERHDRLANDTNPPAYILTTVKHKCLNLLRSRKVQMEVKEKLAFQSARALDVRISTLEALDAEEIFSDRVRQALRNAIDSLPARARAIFIMSRIDEKTYREIAEQLSITVKSVEFELTKATRLLRAILKNSSL
ncbi:DNA-directed RNA polymerase sigma-70 factor [Bacteroidia bacterium]|nr:DNA-directed RNA polymerase sigma-70 factor [Bacteroidia bacterium]